MTTEGKDAVAKTLKEVESFEKSRDFESALSLLEQTYEVHPSHHLTWKLVAKIGAISNTAAAGAEQPAPLLAKAESTLSEWCARSKLEKRPVHQHILEVYALTLNNWGVFHQDQANYHISLNYFLKALKVLELAPVNDVDVLSMLIKTRHNISLLYSTLRRFSDAADHCEVALKLLKKEYQLRRLLGNEKKMQDLVCTYMCVYYTLAAAQGEVGNREERVEALKNGLEMGAVHLPHDHSLMLLLKTALRPSLTHRNLKPVSTQSLLKDTTAFHQKYSAAYSDSKVHTPKPLPIHREPGKYYTDSELETLYKRLQEPNGPRFISADDYFSKKIRKILSLEQDVKHLKKNDEKRITQISRQDAEAKKKIAELRLRRHARHLKGEGLGVDFIKARIELLDKQHQVEVKKKAVQLKSRRKTFKSTERMLVRPLFHCGTTNNLPLCQTAKDEIEGLMDELTADIKQIAALQHTIGKNKKKRLFTGSCSLAESVWKRQNSPQNQLKRVKNSLVSGFKSGDTLLPLKKVK